MVINKAELQIALEVVKPGLASKDVIEQASSFAFVNDRVVTFNNEISLSHPVAGMELKGAIKAEELYSLLHKLKSDEIEVVLTDSEILFTSGRSKAGMTLVSEVKLPLEEINTAANWFPVPKDFLEALKFAVPSCSTSITRPVLMTVHVKEDIVEATDAFRISKFILKEAVPVPEFLLPASSAKQVLKLNPNEMAHSDGWIHFKSEEDTILSCRLFMDDYPNLEVILNQTGRDFTFPKSTLEVFDRATVFSKSETSSLEQVSITMADNKFTIRSESEIGWFEESLNFQYKDEPITFVVVPKILKSVLSETLTCMLCASVMIFKGSNWTYLSIRK